MSPIPRMAVSPTDDEHHIADCRRVSEIEILETLHVQVHADSQCRVVGTAVGEHVGFVEQLQCADGAEHGGQQDCWPQARQGHGAELPPSIRAIDRCGLVEFSGNGLQLGQVDDGVLTSVMPGHGHDDGNLRPCRIREPRDGLQMDQLKQIVDHSAVGVEHVLEQDSVCDQTHDDGQEVTHAENGTQFEECGVERDGQ